jgi:adenylate cyclase
MNINRQRRWRIIRTFAMGWIGGFVFLAIVRGSGTVEQGSAQFNLPVALVWSVVLGVIFGGFAGVAQIVMEERAYRRIPLRRLLAFRVLFAVVSLGVLLLVSYVGMTRLFGVTIGLGEFLVEPGSFAVYFYILSVDFFLVLLRQVNLMFGEGNLWRLLRGRFYEPREEERVFMFLDLESSTAHAEELGHVTYSRLVQDCFDDLGIVSDFGAEVYQYVGDGVVLTWPLAHGMRNQNCLRAFEGFKDRLESRNDYYTRRYGRTPRFTAGINGGAVTVTEVGRYKREIAYHGDTINTAARVQGQCKTFGRDLLMTEDLRDQLQDSGIAFQELGEIPLRGKEEPLALVAVEI